MTRLRPLILFNILLLIAACSASGPTEVSHEPTSPGIQAGYVAVTAMASGLEIRNQTERTVYYFAIERGASAYTDWVPCTFFNGCTGGIAPGAAITVPWDKVAGYRPDAREYLLYWYHVETANGKQTSTSMQSVIVTR